jgi:hypothetical protein
VLVLGGMSGLATGVCGRKDGGGSCCKPEAAEVEGLRLRRQLRQHLGTGTAVTVVDEGRRQAMLISCCPEECLTLTHAHRPLFTNCL